MNLSLLPADSYFVLNKSIISELDKQIITTLYQPIIGHSSVSLYLTLLNEVEKTSVLSVEYTHHHLMTLLQISLSDLLITREKLEAVGLLKTHVKVGNINTYVYTLFSPITPEEFFNHPILNIVLYNNVGKKEYDRLISLFKVPKVDLKEYKDITKRFNEVFKVVKHNKLEVEQNIVRKNKSNIEINKQVDFSLLLSSIPSHVISKKAFTKDIKELINNLSFVYDLDDLEMQRLIRNVIDETGMIDKEELRKQARNLYQYDNSGKLPTLVYKTQPEYLKKELGDKSNWAKMVYTFENTTPFDYLKHQQKGAKPATRDLNLIESLLNELKLNPGVVNVLISYVLKINDSKLNKNYVETIAAQWKRVGIQTVEEAMRYSEAEHKRIKESVNKKSTNRNYKKDDRALPDWFNEEITNVNISSKEEEELKELLKNF